MNEVDIREADSLIAEIGRQADELHDDVRRAERLLATEHFDTSEDVRARLAEARKHLQWVSGDLEQAREQLPVAT